MCKFKLQWALAAILISVAVNCGAEELRDPTRPLGHVASGFTANENPVRLQSVLISETRKVAYINGQQVHEQDTIKGSDIKVIRIESGGVVLQQNTKRWRLDLDKSVIRQ